jgi:hypothetical protein
MFRQYFGIITGSALFFAVAALAQATRIVYFTALQQDFNDVSTLAGQGWTLTNNSSPSGVSSWFQGNNGVLTAQAGSSTAYIAANYLNAAPGGNISNWLILPTLALRNGDILTFYTRTETNVQFADNLEVRLSSNGASANVGTTASSVGDFTNLLLAINPALNVGGYPDAWTRESVTISGLGSMPTLSRLAFRYYVSNTAINGDYIGIDTLTVSEQVVAPEPSTIGLFLAGLGSLGLLARRRSRTVAAPAAVSFATTAVTN